MNANIRLLQINLHNCVRFTIEQQKTGGKLKQKLFDNNKKKTKFY